MERDRREPGAYGAPGGSVGRHSGKRRGSCVNTRGGPNAQRATKEQISSFDHESVREMRSQGNSRSHNHGIRTPEASEGVAAFKEKRKPNWYAPR